MQQAVENERFTQYVRSASFAITLSHAQIQELLRHEKVDELRHKYDWYHPAQVNFGTPEESAAAWITSTIRSLIKKGFISMTIRDLPTTRYDVLQLTDAGLLVCMLLREAQFEADPKGIQAVPLHPDDRHILHLDKPERNRLERVDRDRRDPADLPYLARPYKGVPVSTPVP